MLLLPLTLRRRQQAGEEEEREGHRVPRGRERPASQGEPETAFGGRRRQQDRRSLRGGLERAREQEGARRVRGREPGQPAPLRRRARSRRTLTACTTFRGVIFLFAGGPRRFARHVRMPCRHVAMPREACSLACGRRPRWPQRERRRVRRGRSRFRRPRRRLRRRARAPRRRRRSPRRRWRRRAGSSRATGSGKAGAHAREGLPHVRARRRGRRRQVHLRRDRAARRRSDRRRGPGGRRAREGVGRLPRAVQRAREPARASVSPPR